jgi:succinate dehydrogenase/fumarate reductase flavoprotein subunit
LAQIKECDVLIVGAGGAGLRAAVAAAEAGARVVVVAKHPIGRGGTTFTAASDWMAFGAALGHADPADSPWEHWIDILVKGGLVCRPELARLIAEEAPARLLELEAWGADFDKTPAGRFVQKLSDGARFPRAAGKGTRTGPAILKALLRRLGQLKASSGAGGVELLAPVFVADLLVADGRVVGAWGWELGSGTAIVFAAPAVVLAAGGAGAAYAVNVFPPGASGDGYALALRAGAQLVNMEFIQIGPSLVRPFAFALSGVFWRLEPRLTNAQGEEFLPRYLPPGVDLGEALRLKSVSYPFTVRNESMWIDIAVFSEIAAGRGTAHHGVYMDLRHQPRHKLEEEAAVPWAHLRERGLDIATQVLEFAPAVQHFNGGVRIDEWGRTSVAGLFAAGENAGGQHGADRPGGNSLADCQVFGRRAGMAAAAEAGRRSPDRGAAVELAQAALAQPPRPSGPAAAALRAELGWEMWTKVSVLREAEGLGQAIATAQGVRAALLQAAGTPWERAEVANAALVAEAVARAALLRAESRGTHYRADCRAVNDPAYQRQIACRLDGGELVSELGPIIEPPPELPDLPARLEAASGAGRR